MSGRPRRPAPTATAVLAAIVLAATARAATVRTFPDDCPLAAQDCIAASAAGDVVRIVDELTERLRLNLTVYRPAISAAWQEARYGRLWEQGVEAIDRYNQMNKVEPMQRALDELSAEAWIVGLRRAQASTRRELRVLGLQDGYLKVHPIVDWNDKDVYDYLTRHGLPYHPLWEQGYPSIGGWHTSHKLTDGMAEEETRFFGLKRECGLHESTEVIVPR